MAPRETTVAASVVADMLHHLADRGVATSRVLQLIRLQPGFASSPDRRIAGSRVEHLWQLAVAETGDPMVGLHMGETYNPGSLDILGYVLLSCRTVGELLEKFARYARLMNDGMRIELVSEGDVAYCRFRFVDGIDNYLLRTPEQAVDATWAGVARELTRLPVAPVVAREVWFRRPAPPAEQKLEYERVIGARLRFGVAEDRFIVSASDLERPLRSANAALLAMFERHADAALKGIEREDARANQVARVLADNMKGTKPELRDVARHMAMSSRNLQRVLRESGTSYQELLDEVRRDLAMRHLSDPASSVGQVGYLLGFSEPSAFHRAFRRWTGESPGSWRARGLPAHA